FSPQSAQLHAAWSSDSMEEDQIRGLARAAGLRVKFVPAETARQRQMPLIVKLRNGKVCAVNSISAGGSAGIIVEGDEGLERPVPAEKLFRHAALVAVVRPATSVPDARVDTYIRPYEE